MDRIECQVGVVIELEAGEGELNGIYAAQGMLPQSTAKAPRPSEIEHVVLSVTAKDISLNISALFAFDGELFATCLCPLCTTTLLGVRSDRSLPLTFLRFAFPPNICLRSRLLASSHLVWIISLPN